MARTECLGIPGRVLEQAMRAWRQQVDRGGGRAIGQFDGDRAAVVERTLEGVEARPQGGVDIVEQ